jgi:hypothetical protein
VQDHLTICFDFFAPPAHLHRGVNGGRQQRPNRVHLGAGVIKVTHQQVDASCALVENSRCEYTVLMALAADARHLAFAQLRAAGRLKAEVAGAHAPGISAKLTCCWNSRLSAEEGHLQLHCPVVERSQAICETRGGQWSELTAAPSVAMNTRYTDHIAEGLAELPIAPQTGWRGQAAGEKGRQPSLAPASLLDACYRIESTLGSANGRWWTQALAENAAPPSARCMTILSSCLLVPATHRRIRSPPEDRECAPSAWASPGLSGRGACMLGQIGQRSNMESTQLELLLTMRTRQQPPCRAPPGRPTRYSNAEYMLIQSP